MKKRILLATLVATSALLGGCVVTTGGEPYYVETVRVAPPPLRVEYPGPPPVVGYIWIGGYWNWVGTRHVWVPGRWEAPRHGYIYVPHRWERSGDHWRPHGGRWERDTRPQPQPRPQPQHVPAPVKPRVEHNAPPRYESAPAIRHDSRPARVERDSRQTPVAAPQRQENENQPRADRDGKYRSGQDERRRPDRRGHDDDR
ncbi:YXWGXW repeat-containing protein [Formivibrio citricus]|nr:YXWGXW repeat-containing protein [Formivibrio citricus]